MSPRVRNPVNSNDSKSRSKQPQGFAQYNCQYSDSANVVMKCDTSVSDQGKSECEMTMEQCANDSVLARYQTLTATKPY
jgi:hypothetical protein